MRTTPIDYDALAKQHGAKDVDYDSLAEKYGHQNVPRGTSDTPAPQDQGVVQGAENRLQSMQPQTFGDRLKVAIGGPELTLFNAGRDYLGGIAPRLHAAGQDVEHGMNEAYNLHDPRMGALDAIRGATRGISAFIPGAGNSVENMQNLQNAGKPNEAAGSGLTDLGLIAAGEGAGRIAPPIVRNLSERYGGYKSPVIASPLQSASKVASAIHPPGGIPVGFEEDLAAELPHIRAYAQETGNPFHSQWEASTAARGLANRGLEHFNTNVLGPNAEAQIPVGRSNPFQGFTAPSNGTTQTMNLGDINGRITAINKLLKPAMNAASESKQMTAVERSGLEDERQFLTNKLYNELSQRTGIPPEGIKGLREGYGRQFGIADQIDTARRARGQQMGIAAEGGTVPATKEGLIGKALTTLRGGRDYLANHNFRKAANEFEAQPINYPQPQYPQRLQGDQYNNPFLNRGKRF